MESAALSSVSELPRVARARGEPADPACDPITSADGDVTYTQAGVTWVIDPELLSEFQQIGGIPHGSWSNWPGFSVVKTGPHRAVYRCELPSGEYFVKHFRVRSWRAFFQNLVRPCKADLESKSAKRISDAGLRTIETLAVGRVSHRGVVFENYLISRSIPNTIPLDQFALNLRDCEPRRRRFLRDRLAAALGQLAGQLHAAGIEHLDFHAGNVLVQEGADDSLKLWIIDVHAVRFGRELSAGRAAGNLASLYQFFRRVGTRTDRLRFFRAFASVHALPPGASNLKTFETRCLQLSQQLWNRADRAWRRGNRHQHKLCGPAYGRSVIALNYDWLRLVCEDPELLFQDVTGWCKQSGSHRVAAVKIPVPDGMATAFCKSVEHCGWRRIYTRGRGSAAHRAWDVGHALLRRGIATPRPLLYLEHPGPKSDREYLLTEAIPHSITLAEFCQTRVPGLTTGGRAAWLAGVSQRLASQLKWMHDCGYDHRDLKFQNILVAADPAARETWLLDLEAVRRWPWLPRERAVQNLARLNVSAFHLKGLRLTERLRFLRHYLTPAEAVDWKHWWRLIRNRSQKKRRQNQLRRRPLT